MGIKADYEQALKDWETLWAVGAANDMTGAYVDSDDLIMLLRSPTKNTALHCLERQIHYWFEKGIENGGGLGTPAAEVVADHPHLDEIAERYGYEDCIPESRRSDD